MQDRIADRPSIAARVARIPSAFLASAFLASAFLAGCASTGDNALTSTGNNTLTLFADPGKFQYSSCEQLARQRKSLSTREQELRLLMDRAEQGTGGALINVFAYKADYTAVNEEIRVLENTARSKNCDRPENWRSNSAVR
jgi:hypothetical protein